MLIRSAVKLEILIGHSRKILESFSKVRYLG